MKIINWFQIPATDMDRAVKFYTAVLGASFHRMEHGGSKHAFFAMDTLESERTGGEIVQSAMFGKPGQDGTTIYLSAPGSLKTVLERVEPAGGKIVMPHTGIGENGFIALVLDTEGNRIGLHSMTA
jgi:predicted enzyme related to lactoylglutathione lyase